MFKYAKEMAKSIDISELEEKMCDNECNELTSNNNQTDENMVTDKIPQIERTFDSPDEELALLLQEKMQLHEKGKELEKTVSSILNENLEAIEKRENQGRALENIQKNKKHIADLIRSRISDVYGYCKKFESYFEGVLDTKSNEIQNPRMLSGKDKVIFEQTLLLAESKFKSLKKQISTIEILMKRDSDILCHEKDDFFTIVKNECSKVEEQWNDLLSLLYNV